MLAIVFFDNDGLQTHVDHMLCTMLCLVPFPLQMTTEKETLTFRWVALLLTKDGRLSSVPGGDAPAWLVHSLVGAQLPTNQALQLPASHTSGSRNTRLRSAPISSSNIE